MSFHRRARCIRYNLPVNSIAEFVGSTLVKTSMYLLAVNASRKLSATFARSREENISFRKGFLLLAAMMAVVLAVFEFVSIGNLSLDQWVQDHFYDFHTGRRMIDHDEPITRAIFYTGAKNLAVTVGVASAAVVLLSLLVRRLRPYRRGCFLLTLSLIFVPLLVAGAKLWTNVYMPNQTTRYGGNKPYVKLMDQYPPGFTAQTRGRGFPAGHATAGFAFMSLYFVTNRRRWKRLGLAIGLVLGWTIGLYQTVDGQHYLSHTIVTMILSWMAILVMDRLIPRCAGPVLPPLLGRQKSLNVPSTRV